MKPDIKAGDVFATENPQMLGKAINCFQKIWACDNESKYSHAGVIINDGGDTIEALWTITCQNLWEAYRNKPCIIARYKQLTDESYEKGYLLLQRHIGMHYPWWRLPLHIIPPLAKYLSFTGMPVCSELVAKYLHEIGARHRWWTGTNPDTLVDEWRNWKDFEVIWEGVL